MVMSQFDLLGSRLLILAMTSWGIVFASHSGLNLLTLVVGCCFVTLYLGEL